MAKLRNGVLVLLSAALLTGCVTDALLSDDKDYGTKELDFEEKLKLLPLALTIDFALIYLDALIYDDTYSSEFDEITPETRTRLLYQEIVEEPSIIIERGIGTTERAPWQIRALVEYLLDETVEIPPSVQQYVFEDTEAFGVNFRSLLLRRSDCLTELFEETYREFKANGFPAYPSANMEVALRNPKCPTPILLAVSKNQRCPLFLKELAVENLRLRAGK